MSHSDELKPDPPLGEQDEVLSRSLSPETITLIDAALLSETLENWRKVAMVVARTMEVLDGRVIALPDIYFARRVRYLVENGKLDSQGDLSRMRYSEVRRRKESGHPVKA
jgi:Protein of unknown function